MRLSAATYLDRSQRSRTDFCHYIQIARNLGESQWGGPGTSGRPLSLRGDLRPSLEWLPRCRPAHRTGRGPGHGRRGGIGRVLWNLFAHEIHAVPVPSVPVLTIALIAVGAVVLANVVAAVPGRMAARTPTAIVLRAE